MHLDSQLLNRIHRLLDKYRAIDDMLGVEATGLNQLCAGASDVCGGCNLYQQNLNRENH